MRIKTKTVLLLSTILLLLNCSVMAKVVTINSTEKAPNIQKDDLVYITIDPADGGLSEAENFLRFCKEKGANIMIDSRTPLGMVKKLLQAQMPNKEFTLVDPSPEALQAIAEARGIIIRLDANTKAATIKKLPALAQNNCVRIDSDKPAEILQALPSYITRINFNSIPAKEIIQNLPKQIDGFKIASTKLNSCLDATTTIGIIQSIPDYAERIHISTSISDEQSFNNLLAALTRFKQLKALDVFLSFNIEPNKEATWSDDFLINICKILPKLQQLEYLQIYFSFPYDQGKNIIGCAKVLSGKQFVRFCNALPDKYENLNGLYIVSKEGCAPPYNDNVMSDEQFATGFLNILSKCPNLSALHLPGDTLPPLEGSKYEILQEAVKEHKNLTYYHGQESQYDLITNTPPVPSRALDKCLNANKRILHNLQAVTFLAAFIRANEDSPIKNSVLDIVGREFMPFLGATPNSFPRSNNSLPSGPGPENAAAQKPQLSKEKKT